MVPVARGRRLRKPCDLSVPSLGRTEPPWHVPQPEPGKGMWGRPDTDTWHLPHSAKKA